MKLKGITELKAKLMLVLPGFPHDGLVPYFIEKEVEKSGKRYDDSQYEEAVGQLLDEGKIQERSGLFRRKEHA